MLDLNTEKEGLMAYTAPEAEDAQRPRAACIRHKSRLSRYPTNLFCF